MDRFSEGREVTLTFANSQRVTAGVEVLYLGNKVVYAEQGVPTSGKLAILGIVALYAVAELGGGTWASRKLGMNAWKMLGIGVVLGVLTGLVALIPTGDARSSGGLSPRTRRTSSTFCRESSC